MRSLVELRAAFLAEVAGAANPRDPVLRAALERYFTAAIPDGEFVAYLGVVRDQLIATSGMVWHRHPPSGRNPHGIEAYVMNLYTVPAWRGRGIAAVLLRELIAAARRAKCCRVRLHAVEAAGRLYAREGFTAVSGEMNLDLA